MIRPLRSSRLVFAPFVVVAAFLAGRESSEEEESERPLSEALLEWFDADQDGRVDRFEAGALAMQFVDWFDEDGDGALDETELLAASERLDSEDYEETERLFERYDADDDDRLTRAEVPAAEHELFEFADEDGDDSLTRPELNDAFEAWSEEGEVDPEEEADLYLEDYDADGDRRIQRSEVEEDDEFRDDFAFIDQETDGELTRDELVAYVRLDNGSATFVVRGEVAVVTGTLDSTTPPRVLRLLLEHPEVTTLELRWISGSIDDESNLWALRWIRRRGLSTHVPSGGMVASGGTDFLLAGRRRTVDPGARVGVHSWDAGAIEGRALPRDHEDHVAYLDFCRELEIPEEYYWFTLEAAAAEEMHWVTRDELVRYGMVTE